MIKLASIIKDIKLKTGISVFMIMIVIVFSSCSTLKYSAVTQNQIMLNAENLSLINGYYSRFPNDSNWGEARDLHRLFSLKFLDVGYKAGYVSLMVIDERHIKYELIDIDSIVYSKVLKGKIVNGEFVFKRKARILPIIVATIYSDSKVRLGLLKNGNLLIDARCMDYGLTYFILPIGDGDKKYNQEFEKIEKTTANTKYKQ